MDPIRVALGPGEQLIFLLTHDLGVMHSPHQRAPCMITCYTGQNGDCHHCDKQAAGFRKIHCSLVIDQRIQKWSCVSVDQHPGIKGC